MSERWLPNGDCLAKELARTDPAGCGGQMLPLPLQKLFMQV